jgi:hypothetical protein
LILPAASVNLEKWCRLDMRPINDLHDVELSPINHLEH